MSVPQPYQTSTLCMMLIILLLAQTCWHSLPGTMPKLRSLPSKLQHAWESRSHDWEAASNSDSDSDDEIPLGIGAGRQLVELLVCLLASGAITAQTLCLVCYWASRAGAAACAEWGLRPGSNSGHYQRHVDICMHIDMHSDSLYHIGIPVHTKHDLGRRIRNTPVQPPHELLHQDSWALLYIAIDQLSLWPVW